MSSRCAPHTDTPVRVYAHKRRALIAAGGRVCRYLVNRETRGQLCWQILIVMMPATTPLAIGVSVSAPAYAGVQAAPA